MNMGLNLFKTEELIRYHFVVLAFMYISSGLWRHHVAKYVYYTL